jgi:glyoxylate reductase
MVPRVRAFEMNVIYSKRQRLSPGEERELGVKWVNGTDEVLRLSDFVCVACDYNPTTHLLIGAREFGLMWSRNVESSFVTSPAGAYMRARTRPPP